MKKRFLLLFVFTFLFCSKNSDENKIIATVKDHKISVAAFARSYIDEIQYTPVNVQDSQELREKHLGDMITRYFLSQNALKAGLDTLAVFKKNIYAESTAVIIHGLYEKEIVSNFDEITDEQVKEAFKKMHSELHIRHLVSSTKEGIDSLYQKLVNGESFETLAKKCFHDSTLQNNGGDLGFIKWGDLDIDFENVAYTLGIGEFSKPVETKYGWHIIKVDNILVNPIVRYDEFQAREESIRKQLLNRLLINKADLRIKELMESKNVNMNVPLIQLLENERRRVKSKMNNKLVISQDEIILPMKSLLEKYKNESIATYDGGKWTVGNMLEYLPTVAGGFNTNSVYRTVAMTLRNNFLLQIAKEKRVDKIVKVRNMVDEKRERLLSYIFLNMYADTCSVTDKEAEEFYNKNYKQYNDKKMSVLEILVKTEKKAKEILNTILESNKGEKAFRECAGKYTIRKGMKEKEGYLGIIKKTDYGEIGRACNRLEKGNLMGPIKTKDGYSIVMLVDYAYITIPYESVKEQMKKLIDQNKTSYVFHMFKDDYLKSQAQDIKVNNDILNNIF